MPIPLQASENTVSRTAFLISAPDTFVLVDPFIVSVISGLPF